MGNERTEQHGQEAEQEGCSSASQETARGVEINIDMSITPHFPRTGRERPVAELTRPDGRFSNCFRLDPQDGKWKTLEAEDLQAGYCHADADLSPSVPPKIRERITVAQNLAFYGWFCYEFSTISLFWSLSCIEMALWYKFIEMLPGPLEIVHKSQTEKVSIAEAERKLRQGWRIVGMAKFNFSFRSLLTWALDAKLLPSGVDVEGILQLRNSMAHPTSFNWVLPPGQALNVYKILLQIVGALWPG
jgi:hypothetical protein